MGLSFLTLALVVMKRDSRGTLAALIASRSSSSLPYAGGQDGYPPARQVGDRERLRTFGAVYVVVSCLYGFDSVVDDLLVDLATITAALEVCSP